MVGMHYSLAAYASVVAPFDGVITQRNVDVGALVQGNAKAVGENRASVLLLLILEQKNYGIPVVEWLSVSGFGGPRSGRSSCKRPAPGCRLCELDRCQRLQFCRPTGVHGRAEREEHDAMREIEIHDYARQLLEAHGAKAIAEAAQNAIDLEAKGEVELAKDWRHIEDAMKLMRGPHQS